MCLGIPAKLIEIHTQDDLPMGKVEFGGIRKDVCLAYTPEAQIGDYVLIHVGFAISRIDEAEAQEIFDYLREIEDTSEMAAEGSRSKVQGSRLKSEGAPSLDSSVVNPEPLTFDLEP
jgi:hydrogenase expression/formation protein HypC